MQFNQEIGQYQQKVRVRVCGLLLINDRLLLLKHDGIGKKGHLWSPPGGGMEFGESATDCLKREFKEETNLEVSVGPFLFTNEYQDLKLHAIELFFRVELIKGELKLGMDPELSAKNQILSAAKFFSNSELLNIDPVEIHNAFRYCHQPIELVNLKGFYFFQNI